MSLKEVNPNYSDFFFTVVSSTKSKEESLSFRYGSSEDFCVRVNV